jgi:hypothetical protein
VTQTTILLLALQQRTNVALAWQKLQSKCLIRLKADL